VTAACTVKAPHLRALATKANFPECQIARGRRDDRRNPDAGRARLNGAGARDRFCGAGRMAVEVETMSKRTISAAEIEQINAAGLARARQCVRYIHTVSVRNSSHSWFSKETGHLLTRNVLRQWAVSDPFAMDVVITDAMAGWDDAHKALG